MSKPEQSHLVSWNHNIASKEPRPYHSEKLGLGLDGAGCVSSTEEIVSSCHCNWAIAKVWKKSGEKGQLDVKLLLSAIFRWLP